MEDLGLDEYKIKMDLREVEWENMNWIDLIWGRYRWRAVIDAAKNSRVPPNAGNLLTNRGPASLSASGLLLGFI